MSASSPGAARIVPLAEAHFDALYWAFDAVARERKYLAFEAAPPRADCYAFYRAILERDNPHFVALLGGRVVGWCDALPALGQSRSHVAILGIALLPDARGLGLGARLMQAAINKAWAKGLRRVELTVRADNLRAKRLYERMGFVQEGVARRAFRVDDAFIDSYSMGLLREQG